MRYIVLEGFYSWVRRGCIACSRGQGGLQCGWDAHASNHAHRTVGTVQLPFFWASLLPWIFLASTVCGIVMSLILVCIRSGTPALNVVKRLGTVHPIYRTDVPLLPRVLFLYIRSTNIFNYFFRLSFIIFVYSPTKCRVFPNITLLGS